MQLGWQVVKASNATIMLHQIDFDTKINFKQNKKDKIYARIIRNKHNEFSKHIFQVYMVSSGKLDKKQGIKTLD